MQHSIRSIPHLEMEVPDSYDNIVRFYIENYIVHGNKQYKSLSPEQIIPGVNDETKATLESLKRECAYRSLKNTEEKYDSSYLRLLKQVLFVLKDSDIFPDTLNSEETQKYDSEINTLIKTIEKSGFNPDYYDSDGNRYIKSTWNLEEDDNKIPYLLKKILDKAIEKKVSQSGNDYEHVCLTGETIYPVSCDKKLNAYYFKTGEIKNQDLAEETLEAIYEDLNNPEYPNRHYMDMLDRLEGKNKSYYIPTKIRKKKIEQIEKLFDSSADEENKKLYSLIKDFLLRNMDFSEKDSYTYKPTGSYYYDIEQNIKFGFYDIAEFELRNDGTLVMNPFDYNRFISGYEDLNGTWHMTGAIKIDTEGIHISDVRKLSNLPEHYEREMDKNEREIFEYIFGYMIEYIKYTNYMNNELCDKYGRNGTYLNEDFLEGLKYWKELPDEPNNNEEQTTE